MIVCAGWTSSCTLLWSVSAVSGLAEVREGRKVVNLMETHKLNSVYYRNSLKYSNTKEEHLIEVDD